MARAYFVPAVVLMVTALALPACGGGGVDTAPQSGGAGGGTAGTGASAGAGGVAGSGASAGTGGVAGSGGTAGGGGPCKSLCTTPDADCDNIPDDVEGKAQNRDTDHDGIPDYLDTDSDGDTIPDKVEAGTINGCSPPLDSDNDGIPNYLDTDSDNNGIPDRDEIYPDGSAYDASKTGPKYVEGLADTDGDGIPDVYDDDNDGDTLLDKDELVGGKAVDTDKDGLPDMDDIDSDGDTIADVFEGLGDPDKDGVPNDRDLDSDNDGVPDACEAGFGHTLLDKAGQPNPPVDTDGDGTPDFLDVDSDGDGLMDGQEDRNGNCQVDLNPKPAETDRTKYDSDGDGANDLIEVTLGSDPNCSTCTPQALGKYYFVLPYQQDPEPLDQDVVLKTNLNKGDIGFVVDTTGSMGPAIANIRSNLSSLISAVKAEVPDARFGVLGHDDYPIGGYGDKAAGDLPVWLPGPSAYLSGNANDTVLAVGNLTLHSGGDNPEAQIPAMFRALQNTALTWPSGSVQPFSPGSGFGGLGFRPDALPIIVSVTDAPYHNGRRVNASSTLHDLYSFNTSNNVPTVDKLVAKMNAHGAKFVGVSLDNGAGRSTGNPGDPYLDMAYIADKTNSLVKPTEAFGTSKCLTNIAGGGINPDGPNNTCRLIFSAYKNGGGTAKTLQDGILALLRGIHIDVRVVAVSVEPPYLTCGGKLVNAVDDLIDHIDVFAPGAIPDPADPGYSCATIDTKKLRDWYKGPRGVVGGAPPNDSPDSYDETAIDITPGTRICFKVVPKKNTFCPQTAKVQVARASLIVHARNVGQSQDLIVGQPRDVFFVIPPKFQ